MKKIILVLLLTVLVVPFVVRFRVHAVEPTTNTNYSGLWEIHETEDVWYFYFNINFSAGTFGEVLIEIPICPICVDADGEATSSLNIRSEGGSVWAEPLSTHIITDDYATAVDVTINFDIGTVISGGFSDTESDIQFADSFTITIILNIVPTTPLLYSWVVNNIPVWGVSRLWPVLFYDRFVIYDMAFWDDTLSTPTAPTPPAGYTFIGWKTKTGVLFDFDNPVLYDSMITDVEGYGVVAALYAYYGIATDTETEVTPTPADSTVPLFISGPLGMIGLDNAEGYFLIFLIIFVLLIVGLLMIPSDRAKSFILLTLFIWTSAGTWLGLIPFWGAAVLLAIEGGILIKSLSSEGDAA